MQGASRCQGWAVAVVNDWPLALEVGGAAARGGGRGQAASWRRDLAAEFEMPNLRPSSMAQSCAVLAEAAMLRSHTYSSLANNRPAFQTDAHTAAFEVLVAFEEKWSGIVERKQDVVLVLEETAVRGARAELMQNMDALRGTTVVEATADRMSGLRRAATAGS